MTFLDRIFGRKRAHSVEDLRERLDRFRDLVERNNQVLELIADAGEKLGGEYIFDSKYLQDLADRLEDAVRSTVYDLNAISDASYPELVEAVTAIRQAVEQVLDARVAVPQTDWVVPLHHAHRLPPAAVGQKMGRLSELAHRMGFRVPEGFVITAAACEAFLVQPALVEPIAAWERAVRDQDGPAISRSAGALRKALLVAPLPKGLEREIRRAISRLKKKCACRTLAVRSSATEEDGEQSFAGQYLTQLGVPFDDVGGAYPLVVSSLFSPQVVEYRRRAGGGHHRGSMAVGCLALVDARASGVLYTLDPERPAEETLVITAAMGLGTTVVEGSGGADRTRVSKRPPYPILDQEVGVKEEMVVPDEITGVKRKRVVVERQTAPALSPEEIQHIAEAGLRVERFLKCAQDIEWALDDKGQLVLLQNRPLRLAVDLPSPTAVRPADLAERYPVLLQGQGLLACRGIGAGPVVVVEQNLDLTALPPHPVLVARTSSPRLAVAVAKAAAVITDIGATTGHLATIAREFRVPMIVEAGDATHRLRGAGEVTVDAEENTVYSGVVHELLQEHLLQVASYEEQPEFRKLRRILDHVAPLHLHDPNAPEFTVESCTSYHDVIRFAHEKAVQHLIESARVRVSGRNDAVRKLNLDIPIDLLVIDLGDGLDADPGRKEANVEQVRSRPLQALLEGLTEEGAWSTQPADMDLDGFMASLTRTASLTGPGAMQVEQNLAIVSEAYLHLSLKLGYHFNVVDCYLTDVRNDNFLYFRFAGGVTEADRRNRRARLLRRILEAHDFRVEGRGDLVIGRIKKLPPDEMTARLHVVGRLVGFSRQLDIFLKDETRAEECYARFMETTQ